MKKLAILLVAIGSLLSACVAYEAPDRDGREHRVQRGDRDRDGDGVPNRMDRRPDDPRRY